MPQPVIGLIGCGFIGRFHSRNLRGSLRSELVPGEYAAVCDREVSRAEAFAALTGAKTVTSNAAAVFDRPGLNSVYICTETAEHPALVLEAARHGLNVFCEKPLAKSIDEVRAMVEAVESAGVVNQVGLVLRYSPVFTVLKEIMEAPDLGPFLTAHLRDDQFFPTRGSMAASGAATSNGPAAGRSSSIPSTMSTSFAGSSARSRRCAATPASPPGMTV
ncbi:MAG: Gfo/Idh/MocA family oxidoreductase [Dehalococcoidia bacterium]|nr:Gfo/Idh/MocA family oxidoreductase [Dehalococcoidia bacterium]